MEKVDLKKIRCQAKVIGTVVTVAGALLMTLYKGHVINLVWSQHIHSQTSSSPEAAGSPDKDWLKGSILLIFATLAWASFFILQAVTMKRYPAHLSLTSIVCFLGTLQSIAVTYVMEHKASVWTIGWDMNLLAAAYAGIVTSGIAYYVQGLIMQKRGPVFVTAFSPLIMIIVAIMGSFILAEKIFVGSVVGAVLIVMGLYSVLWGKYKEYQEKEEESTTIREPIEDCGATTMDHHLQVEQDDIEMQKNSSQPSNPSMKAIEAPKA